MENKLKEDQIAGIEKQAKTMVEQIKIEGIKPVTSSKVRNPKYDPKWEDMF